MCSTVFKGRYDGTRKPIQNRALLVIDVQNEYFTGKLPVCYPKNTLPNILNAITEAQAQKIPVIMIQHTLTTPGATAFIKQHDGWQLHESVRIHRKCP